MKGLTIRLRRRKFSSRTGYDIVLMHKYKRPGADFIERLGVVSYTYPNNMVFVNIERLAYWLNKGAKLNYKSGYYIIQLFTRVNSN